MSLHSSHLKWDPTLVASFKHHLPLDPVTNTQFWRPAGLQNCIRIAPMQRILYLSLLACCAQNFMLLFECPGSKSIVTIN